MFNINLIFSLQQEPTMVHASSSPDIETLGQFLQRQRTEKGVDLLEVAEETRIPPGTLKAMENGDYAALPADAFARGFYSIYSRFLNLDGGTILERYTKERSATLKHHKKTAQPPLKLGETVSPMAERPLITPFSMLSFGLVLLVLITISICWFFSWNPANFLSEKLRSFGKTTAVEQRTETGAPLGSQSSASDATKTLLPGRDIKGQALDAGQNAAGPNAGKFALQAEFQEPTKVTVTVDEEFPAELTFPAGQTHNWHAKNSIILALPPNTKTRLTLNGAVLPLPGPVNGYITVSIPGSTPK
jgi:cytoskeleton protein RodZ